MEFLRTPEQKEMTVVNMSKLIVTVAMCSLASVSYGQPLPLPENPGFDIENAGFDEVLSTSTSGNVAISEGDKTAGMGSTFLVTGSSNVNVPAWDPTGVDESEGVRGFDTVGASGAHSGDASVGTSGANHVGYLDYSKTSATISFEQTSVTGDGTSQPWTFDGNKRYRLQFWLRGQVADMDGPVVELRDDSNAVIAPENEEKPAVVDDAWTQWTLDYLVPGGVTVDGLFVSAPGTDTSGEMWIDTFSITAETLTTEIPEPATGFIGLGTLLLITVRSRNRRSQFTA